jgi:hypothetical protein
MKKTILLAAICIAGFVSAKGGETNKKLQYAYLYQSTCGWTFNMYTDTPVGQMSASQYDDYMDELLEVNDRVCKLHGVKSLEVFTFNESFSTIIKDAV